MTAIELKNNFHHLIDSIENENLLQKFYELMLKKRSTKDGSLWVKLSPEEVNELLEADKESEDAQNLIPDKEVRKKYI